MDHLKRLLQNIPTLTGNTDLFEVQEEEDVFVDTMSGDDAGTVSYTHLDVYKRQLLE